MECESLLLVQAEFDGELDAADALRAAQHRQTCAECRDAYAQLSATHALMRESAPRLPSGKPRRKVIWRACFAPRALMRFSCARTSPIRLTWRSFLKRASGGGFEADFDL